MDDESDDGANGDVDGNVIFFYIELHPKVSWTNIRDEMIVIFLIRACPFWGATMATILGVCAIALGKPCQNGEMMARMCQDSAGLPQ